MDVSNTFNLMEIWSMGSEKGKKLWLTAQIDDPGVLHDGRIQIRINSPTCQSTAHLVFVQRHVQHANGHTAIDR